MTAAQEVIAKLSERVEELESAVRDLAEFAQQQGADLGLFAETDPAFALEAPRVS